MLTLVLLSSVTFAQQQAPTALNNADRPYALSLHAELGALKPLVHNIQFSQSGTQLDYVKDGGQDVAFPFLRLSADAHFGPRHTATFLYQPLDIQTQVWLTEDLVVDDATFPADSAVDLRYGFSFWRGSYTYDLLPGDKRELALGLGLQIRNANIQFTSANGELRRTNRDIGPVPLLKVRARTPVGDQGYWVGTEVDGFYAPIKYLNGGTSDVVGAILDASVRAGVELDGGVHPFLNLRAISGGATGTSSNPTPPGDGYNRNWLTFMSLSLGVDVR